MKNIMPCVLWLSLIMFPLTASCASLSIEEDPHDPKLHGQVVRFNVPVVYMELTEEDSNKYPDKEIEIGRILISEWDSQNLYNRNKTHVTEDIKENTKFTIIESYWIRQDWFKRELAPDVNRLILQDEGGTLSIALRSLLYDSNKPELIK